MDFFRSPQHALRRGWPPIFYWLRRRRIAMKQFIQKISATVGAILVALVLVGLNADQVIAQGKGRKGAKVRAGSAARIAPTTGSSNNAVTATFLPTPFRNVARAEAFSVDIGTSENLRPQVGNGRRKITKH